MASRASVERFIGVTITKHVHNNTSGPWLGATMILIISRTIKVLQTSNFFTRRLCRVGLHHVSTPHDYKSPWISIRIVHSYHIFAPTTTHILLDSHKPSSELYIAFLFLLIYKHREKILESKKDTVEPERTPFRHAHSQARPVFG